MNENEQRAILTIALLAAFADGTQGEREREEVRRVAESLGGDPSMPALVQQVLLGRAPVSDAAAGLTTPALRHLAYELAVGVCDADGLRNDQETRFLSELGSVLGLAPPEAEPTVAAADALATSPLEEGQSFGPLVASVPSTSSAELEKMILNYSILNGALELLPQTVASMAIIPLQMKMVYRVGRAHGFELDRGHVTDFLATVGVGLTGQYLEGIGRRLMGGLVGRVAGRMAGRIARGATGAAFSFATTYALGHVAARYYAGGRTMSTQMLRDAFTSMLGRARSLQAEYAPQIEEQARTLDVGRIVEMVRSR